MSKNVRVSYDAGAGDGVIIVDDPYEVECCIWVCRLCDRYFHRSINWLWYDDHGNKEGYTCGGGVAEKVTDPAILAAYALGGIEAVRVIVPDVA